MSGTEEEPKLSAEEAPAEAKEDNVEEAAAEAAADAGGDDEKKEGGEKSEPKKETKGEASPKEGGKKSAIKPRGETNDELTKRLQKLALERQKMGREERLRVIQDDASSHLSSVRTFQELNLPKHLLDAVFTMGFERPSAIQEEALPRILADPPRNLIGQAQSGSGKTAAFVIGMLYRIEVDTPATTQALCVTPTRELAVQIFTKSVTPMACNMKGLKVQLALSGENIEKGQTLDAHMVVGTPGKIVDWLKKRILRPNKIKVFVLDEADNMVGESGHRANSLLIKKQMPKRCQSLFFSATFPPKVVDFATKMVYKPDKILLESEEVLVSAICSLELAFL
uniref:RNA helicase n=1 Tax=Ditylum brightwellii TaxID=49249 RepID=A0A7S4UGC0_9STRA